MDMNPGWNRRVIQSRLKGFTLVELIVVIVIVGIISALGGMLITNHMEGYSDTRRRAELVDSAESALRRMQRDVRAAVPNSIRIWECDYAGNTYEGITFLHTVAGGLYRDLVFNGSGGNFTMVGNLTTNNTEEIESGSVVIYNVGHPPYSANTVKEPNNRRKIDYINSTGNVTFHLEGDSFSSILTNKPSSFQVMGSQVRYVKEESKLMRYENNATEITKPEPSGSSCTPDKWGDGALVARHVHNASFTLDTPETPPPWGSRAVLILELTLSEDREKVSLLHQVHVLNTP